MENFGRKLENMMKGNFGGSLFILDFSRCSRKKLMVSWGDFRRKA